MQCELKTTDGPCQWCAKGKQFFLVRSETFTGKVCAVHLDALLAQAKPADQVAKTDGPVTQ